MSRYFSASTDKIQKSGAGNTATDNYSAFVLFKPVSLGSNMYLMYNGHGQDTGEGWGLYLRANTLQLAVDISFVADYASGLFANLNKWNRVVYMRRSGTNKMFLNGKVSPNTSSSGPFSPNGYYTIGASPNSGGTTNSPMKGGISKPALWSRALSDAQAIALTKGIILPHQVPQSLDQYHHLYGRASTEKPFRFGNDLTVTGTQPFPEPPPINSLFRSSLSLAKAGDVSGLAARRMTLLGVG